MGKGRLEAFTDGVIAIVITIMVLDMKVPAGSDLAALSSALPIFLVYALSYTNVAIFWNNHHHMLHATECIDGKVLWANLFLLFWISLMPFVIRWMDESRFHRSADRRLWGGAHFGRDRLSPVAMGNHRMQRPKLEAGCGGGQRFERQIVVVDLRCRDRAGLPPALDRDRVICRGRADLVCAGPAH